MERAEPWTITIAQIKARVRRERDRKSIESIRDLILVWVSRASMSPVTDRGRARWAGRARQGRTGQLEMDG